MSVNNYEYHLLIIPEDNANRELANGFLRHPNINLGRVRVLGNAGGWKKAIDSLDEMCQSMAKYQKRHVLILIDFDKDSDERKKAFSEKVDDSFQDRCFLLGCLDEPEILKKELNESYYENIGKKLAESCYDNKIDGIWHCDQLNHNSNELKRLKETVRPFLF